jgi:hypothetical protein
MFGVTNVADGSFASILACPQHVRLRGRPGSSGCPILPIEGIGLAGIQQLIEAQLRQGAKCGG